MTPTIYTPWNENFGDQWATINLMLRLAHHNQRNDRPPPRLSRLQHGRDLGPLHDEILACLRIANVLQFESVPEPGNTPLSGYNIWATEYYPTFWTWSRDNAHKHVVYQLDGLSTPELKNGSAEDDAKVLATVAATGLPAYRLGKHLGLRKSIELASTAAFFVGVDSGISHVCHSVGVPIFLLQYKLPVVTCHRGKSYILCEGADDFAIKLGRWIDYRKFIGAGL